MKLGRRYRIERIARGIEGACPLALLRLDPDALELSVSADLRDVEFGSFWHFDH